MRILLTNDDGVHAPGLAALYDALIGADRAFSGPLAEGLFTIAPETVQSASSHGITYHQPVMVEDVRLHDGAEAVAVSGRPADCVKLALADIWPSRFGSGGRPDLVISGMNAGANIGINVIYSGTVAAALEAAFLGVPAIAVSLHLGKGQPNFARAARIGRRAIERVLQAGPPAPGECLNINIPRMDAEFEQESEDLPIVVCPMNTHGLNDQYERRISPSGETYYWASGSGLDFHTTDAGSDVQHLLQRHVTITPLWHDLTSQDGLERWKGRLG